MGCQTLGFRAITPVFDGAKEEEIEAELARAWMIDDAWKETAETAWDWLKDQEYDPETIQDDDEVRRLYLEQWLGERGYDVYRLSSKWTMPAHAADANGCAIRALIPDKYFA